MVSFRLVIRQEFRSLASATTSACRWRETAACVSWRSKRLQRFLYIFFYLSSSDWNCVRIRNQICRVLLQPVAACAMPVMKGWNILTNSEKTRKARWEAPTSLRGRGGLRGEESSRWMCFCPQGGSDGVPAGQSPAGLPHLRPGGGVRPAGGCSTFGLYPHPLEGSSCH